MQLDYEVFDALASLLTYPADGRAEEEQRSIRVLREACPEAGPDLDRFLAATADMTPGEREELFTRTFDSTDERSLEIGWQLFGENYARGVLMVRLRGLLRKYGVEEGSELPDHLSHVLPLLGRVPRQLAEAMAQIQVLPAVEKALAGCVAAESPYAAVLEVVRRVVAVQAEPAQSMEASAR